MRPPASIGAPLAAVVLLVVACSTGGGPSPMPLDASFTLQPDQGALIVEVEASEPVLRLEIEPVEGLRSSVRLTKLAAGRSAQILILRAGTYRWSEFDMRSLVTIDGREYPATWKLAAAEAHWRFEVRPGVVSYPGVLVLARASEDRMRIYTLNRSAQLVQKIHEGGGAHLDRQSIVYSGRGRDDFLEFYSSKLAREREQAVPVDVPSSPSN